MTIKGIAVSPGISIGRALLLKKRSASQSGILLKDETSRMAEVSRFDLAIAKSMNDLEGIKGNKSLSLGAEELEILETQIEWLGDPQIREGVVERISTQSKNANDALIEVIDEIMEIFQNMKDEYMRARSADVRDIGDRILRNLDGENPSLTISKGEESILIAVDILPSDTMNLDLTTIVGLAAERGGKTSHAAIIAKSKGLPALVGCGDALQSIQAGDLIILDGIDAILMVNPTAEIVELYKKKKIEWEAKSALRKSLKSVASKTTDGKPIHLLGNISNPEEMDFCLEHGGEGVGLFRSEMLFMQSKSMPTEEEQFECFRNLALRSKKLPVTVRTFDIGGDKPLAYLDLPPEENPFLGYRAIRISLERKDLFIQQLKAILRASVFGQFSIMFPMVGSLDEIRASKAVLAEAKMELIRQHISFDPEIKIGIMVEIPAAAMMADLLAKEVDFFSIGTNDLIQYSLAVDRMNEKVSGYYDSYNPGVLRLINNTIVQAIKHKIRVGMCGELASDPMATQMLIGMGLEEFSMSAASIPEIKQIILNSNLDQARKICKRVMELDNSLDIRSYLKEMMK
jgi:phosphoenolpyruvate-protein phosphotransferase (PTS system enzyme I)